MKFVFAIIFLTSITSLAAPLTCVGTYKVALNESAPLYFQDGKEKRYIGASIDVVNELRRRTKCKFITSVLNRSRLISELKSYRIDFIMVTVKNPIFDSLANFILLDKAARIATVSTTDKNKYKNFSDLMNDPKLHFYILPAVTVFFTPQETERLEKEGRFWTATSIQNSYEILSRSTYTAVVQGTWVADYFESTMKIQYKHQRIKDTENLFDTGIYVRKNMTNQQDINAISKALQDMKDDGTWEKITSRYANFGK